MILGPPTVCVDRQGIIEVWDAESEKLFGYTADEAIGQSLNLIVPTNLRARHWAGFHQFVRTGRSYMPDITNTTGVAKGGRLIRLAISVEVIRDDSGEIIGVAATIKEFR